MVMPGFPGKLARPQRGEMPYEKLLLKHTILPLLMITSKAALKGCIIQYWEDKHARSIIFDDVKGTTLWDEIMYCPACLRKQIENHGFSWFLRNWQAPLVTCCPEHNTRLIPFKCECNSKGMALQNVVNTILTGYCE